MTAKNCPNCGASNSYIFHHLSSIPVNSCLLFSDRKRAQSLPHGDMHLAFCSRCGFIFNAAWQDGATTYSELYEETQAYSPTYCAFQRELAQGLIERYDVFGKEIVEIGCGKGAFLALLCELGGNSGVGYDPSFVPGRSTAGIRNIDFRREYFSETTEQSAADFVCCRMTLEHIFETSRFVRAVRRIATPDRGTIVFFQVPDVRRILVEGAFWDIYYEHCSYFSPTSLRNLFHQAGFDVLRITTGFDNQYLTIEARPAERPDTPIASLDDQELACLERNVAAFAQAAEIRVADWVARIRAAERTGARIVLWGSGSKAVAFLSQVGAAATIEYLIDINPHRWGKFVPGTGKQIVSPEHLSRYRPDMVIAMNPIYRQEIAEDLDRYGCGDSLLCALGDASDEPVPATMLTGSLAGN